MSPIEIKEARAKGMIISLSTWDVVLDRLIELEPDAERWRFMMAALNNPSGPENQAFEACGGNSELDPTRSEAEQACEVLDRAIAMCKE